jgi:hypothetical protein
MAGLKVAYAVMIVTCILVGQDREWAIGPEYLGRLTNVTVDSLGDIITAGRQSDGRYHLTKFDALLRARVWDIDVDVGSQQPGLVRLGTDERDNLFIRDCPTFR